MHALSAAFFARRMSSSAPAILSFLSRAAAAQHFCRSNASPVREENNLRKAGSATALQGSRPALAASPRVLLSAMFLAAALAAPGRPLLPQTVETGGPPSDATAVEPQLREPLVTALVGKGCCVTHSDAPEALLAAPPRLLDRAGCAAACAANPSCASFAVAGCEGEEDGACEGGHASAKSQCDELQGQHCDANCFLYSSAPKMREDGGCGWEGAGGC